MVQALWINNMTVPPKIKNRITTNFTSGHMNPKELKAECQRDRTYTHVHSSITRNNQEVKATQGPLTDQWIHNMWYIHTRGYYSALKRSEVLTCATLWIYLEDTVQSEIN